MPISFNCACGKAFRVKDELAGKRAKCPACQAQVVVPLVSESPAGAGGPTGPTSPTGPTGPSRAAPSRPAAAMQPAPTAPQFSAVPPPPPPPMMMPSAPSMGVPYGVPSPPMAAGFQPPMQQANPFFLGSDPGAQNFVVPGMVPMTNMADPYGMQAVGGYPQGNPMMSGMEMPQSGMGNPYQSPGMMLGQAGFMDAAPARPKKKKFKPAPDRGNSSGGEGMFNAGVGLGVLMIVGAVVWFVAGLAGGYIFFYPPFLFIAGLVSIGKGLMGRS